MSKVTGIPGFNKGMKKRADGTYGYPPKPPAKPLTCQHCGGPGRFVLAPSEVICESCYSERYE